MGLPVRGRTAVRPYPESSRGLPYLMLHVTDTSTVTSSSPG